MVKEFSIISELREIRKKKSWLSEREHELAVPILTDIELIPVIYGWFSDILSNMDFPPCLDRVLQRKKFLYIILFLFAPSTLAGGRMPNGIRKSLEDLFSHVRPCTISNNVADTVFFYQQYKDFRADIDNIYIQIMDRLKAKGLIK